MSSTGNTLRESSLPSSWYHEDAIFELERRAIFGKTWLLISHSLQFDEPGKYSRYEIAGYKFFVIKDRQGNIAAFLNACRHRAFPLVFEDTGKANILACKYHGWSYGLNGNLAKAPKFDLVDNFNKSEYSLFKLHTHIDQQGFVWVNLDGSSSPSMTWEQQFQGVDTQKRLENFPTKDYKYDHTWTMDGAFNWKSLIENYNECYHCPTAHPGLSLLLDPKKKLVYDLDRYYIMHMADGSDEANAMVSPTWLFPNASITMFGSLFYLMSIVPKSSKSSLMRYEVYRHVNATQEEFDRDLEFFRQVETEDKFLANGAQNNYNTETFVSGPMHPDLEIGVIHFHSIVRNMIKEHAQKEQEKGSKIWPTRREVETAQVKEDLSFCDNVCSHQSENGTRSPLVW